MILISLTLPYFSGKIPIFKIGMETVMIQDFTVFLEVMILKMIQDFLTQDIKIPEMFQNTTVIDKSCLKIAMIPSIDITNGFQIVKRIVLGIQIMTLAGTLIILKYPGFSEDGYLNCKVSQDDFFFAYLKAGNRDVVA